MHVWCVNHWEEIVQEQLAMMDESRLSDVCTLRFGAIGETSEIQKLQAIVNSRLNCDLTHFGEDPHNFEFPTLDLLRFRARKTPGFTLYTHTKGVSYPCDRPLYQWWRQTMLLELVENWGTCLDRLKDHDTVGCHFYHNGGPLPYYAGNFWWARNDYLSELPICDRKTRYEAEIWITQANPRAYWIPVGKSL